MPVCVCVCSHFTQARDSVVWVQLLLALAAAGFTGENISASVRIVYIPSLAGVSRNEDKPCFTAEDGEETSFQEWRQRGVRSCQAQV